MDKAKKLLETLTPEEKETVYRHVWFEHVVEDIKSYLADNDETLTDAEINYAAKRYVFDGKYDCTLPYWSNIESVIDLAREFCVTEITKFVKPVPTDYVRIRNYELSEASVVQILEELPAKDYDVDTDVADALVDLGYLTTCYGPRQNVYYKPKNREACNKLYQFLFSDDQSATIEL